MNLIYIEENAAEKKNRVTNQKLDARNLNTLETLYEQEEPLNSLSSNISISRPSKHSKKSPSVNTSKITSIDKENINPNTEEKLAQRIMSTQKKLSLTTHQSKKIGQDFLKKCEQNNLKFSFFDLSKIEQLQQQKKVDPKNHVSPYQDNGRVSRLSKPISSSTENVPSNETDTATVWPKIFYPKEKPSENNVTPTNTNNFEIQCEEISMISEMSSMRRSRKMRALQSPALIQHNTATSQQPAEKKFTRPNIPRLNTENLQKRILQTAKKIQNSSIRSETSTPMTVLKTESDIQQPQRHAPKVGVKVPLIPKKSINFEKNAEKVTTTTTPRYHRVLEQKYNASNRKSGLGLHSRTGSRQSDTPQTPAIKKVSQSKKTSIQQTPQFSEVKASKTHQKQVSSIMNIKITQSSDEQVEFQASGRSHNSKAPNKTRVSYLTSKESLDKDETSPFKLELIKCDEGSSIDVYDQKKVFCLDLPVPPKSIDKNFILSMTKFMHFELSQNEDFKNYQNDLKMKYQRMNQDEIVKAVAQVMAFYNSD